MSEVEDAKSIDDLIASASMAGKPILDFENLDFKIASGVTKIQTWNFKKQVTTAEKRSLTDRHSAWMIYDFFTTGGDSEAILDFRDLSKVPVNNHNVQVFDTKWDEVLSAVTDRLTDNTLESLFKMQVEKSQEMKYLLQVFALGDKTYNHCRLKLMAPRHLEQKILISKRDIETRTDTCNRSFERRYSWRTR